MEDKPSLKLLFFSFIPKATKIISYRLSFDNNIYKIDSSERTHEIPEDVFKYGKDKTSIFIELFDDNNKKLSTINFPVLYGKNNKYLESEGNGNGFSFDMIFKNCENLKVTSLEKVFDLFDDNGTKDRKQLTILNYNLMSINVNSVEINLNKEIQNMPSPSSDFYQFSIIDIKENIIIVQAGEINEQPDLKKLMEQKMCINNFYKELNELLQDKWNYKNHYFLILDYYKKKIKYIDFNLNTSNKYLDEYFKDNLIELDIIYKYLIFELFSDGKRKYSKNKELFQRIVNEIKRFYDKINTETKLKTYEKIMLLAKISWIYLECMDIESFNKINIQYYILYECEKNSIIDKAKNFYHDFVSELSTESKIFSYLLNINSGIGYYKGESVYTFDMTNLETLKRRLKELFPNILLFYYLKNRDIANINRYISCIAINKYNLFYEHTNENIIFDKYVENNEDDSNDLAVDLFILFLHECMGHKKFGFNRSKSISPKKIIDENNEIIEFGRFCDYKNDGKVNISSNICKYEEDSGFFLEFAYGKFGRNLLTHLMLKIADKGKLIKRADLFADSSCEILRKYIILKIAAKKEGISIPQNISVEEEIKEYEKKIDYEKLMSEKTSEKEKEIHLLGKKFKRIANNDIEDDSDFNNTEKNKNMDNSFIEGKNEIKDENESEKEDSENSEYLDNEKIFEKLYEKIIEKYGFKEDEQILKNIYEKLKDDSIEDDEIDDLRFVFNYMSNIS